MLIDVPVMLFKVPRTYDVTDRQTKEKTGQIRFITSILVEGEALDCFTDTDLTRVVDPERKVLGSGAPVECVATLELSAYQGKLRHDLLGLSKAPAAEPAKAETAKADAKA